MIEKIPVRMIEKIPVRVVRRLCDADIAECRECGQILDPLNSPWLLKNMIGLHRGGRGHSHFDLLIFEAKGESV